MKNERYPMGKDQLAQIDCRIDDCIFYKGGGQCANISPAITLNPDKTFVCWSKKIKEIIEINKIIKEKTGKELGIEILIGTSSYFISYDQNLWKVIRTGSFPISFDSKYRKVSIFKKEIENE